MDQATQLKIEFFELVRLLNQSNLKTNQKTEISFFIGGVLRKSVLYATTNKVYKIQLIFKLDRHQWKPCGFSGLSLIEVELSELFNHRNLENFSYSEITNIIKSFVFKQFDEN